MRFVEREASATSYKSDAPKGSVGTLLHFMLNAGNYTSAPGYLQGDCRPGPKAPLLLRYATLCNHPRLCNSHALLRAILGKKTCQQCRAASRRSATQGRL